MSMETMETFLFNTAFVGYSAALALYLIYAFTRRESVSRTAYVFLSVSVGLHAVSLAALAWAAHAVLGHGWYVPWSNWFGSFSLFALLISAVFLIVQAKTHLPILGVFVLPWTWLALLI